MLDSTQARQRTTLRFIYSYLTRVSASATTAHLWRPDDAFVSKDGMSVAVSIHESDLGVEEHVAILGIADDDAVVIRQLDLQ